MLITIVSVLIFSQQTICSPSVSSDNKEVDVYVLTANSLTETLNNLPVALLAKYCNRVSKPLRIERNTPPNKFQTEYG